MTSLFGYIHYRVYGFFKERGDNSSPEFSATLILSLIQCFTILDVMVIVKIFRDYPFPNKLYFLPPLIVANIINWYKYERNYDAERIGNRWKDEPTTKRTRNGWMIALYLIITLLIPAVYGYLHVNLKLF